MNCEEHEAAHVSAFRKMHPSGSPLMNLLEKHIWREHPQAYHMTPERQQRVEKWRMLEIGRNRRSRYRRLKRTGSRLRR